MTSINNRTLLLYYVKLCDSVQIHWIQTEFTVQKRSVRVEIGDMLSRVTLKFDRWPWKTTGHLFYATSSFLQHFVAIGDSNWSYSSDTPNLGQIRRFLECATLKFDGWPWKTMGHLVYFTSSFVHHFVPIGEFKLELQYGNAHFGSKSTIFLAVWLRNLTDDPQKQ